MIFFINHGVNQWGMEHAKGMQLHNIAIQNASSLSKSKTPRGHY